MKNQIEKLLENFVPEGQQEKTDFKVFQDFAADEKNLNRSSIAHFTASAFVLNESHDKILGIYHRLLSFLFLRIFRKIFLGESRLIPLFHPYSFEVNHFPLLQIKK